MKHTLLSHTKTGFILKVEPERCDKPAQRCDKPDRPVAKDACFHSSPYSGVTARPGQTPEALRPKTQNNSPKQAMNLYFLHRHEH